MDKNVLLNRMAELQNSIHEVGTTGNGRIRLIFNGRVEIVELQVPSIINGNDQADLMAAINTGIKQVSQRIQQAMLQIQREMAENPTQAG